MSEFTEGQWEVGESVNDGIYITSSGIDIAKVYFMHVGFQERQKAKANALLMSKSKEMFKILKNMLLEFEYDNATKYQCELFYNAKKIIKEATEI